MSKSVIQSSSTTQQISETGGDIYISSLQGHEFEKFYARHSTLEEEEDGLSGNPKKVSDWVVNHLMLHRLLTESERNIKLLKED